VDKATAVLEEFTSAVVQFDPEAASRAQISMMEEELNSLGRRVAEAEAEVAREQRETLELKKSYGHYLQAARLLEEKIAAAEDPGDAATTEASLAKLVDRLELMKPEIDREEWEDQEVEAWRRELRDAFEDLSAKLQRAHTDLKSARRQMDMASLQKERALEQERRSRTADGLSNSLNSLGVALDAMNRETTKVRSETEAFKLKSELRPVDILDRDPNVAQALAAARGENGANQGLLSERLAALTIGGGGDRNQIPVH
jgi:chromosome segregation ATPase